MIIKKINDFFNGWIIGDFEPSLLKTKNFELGIHTYSKGFKAKPHYHKLSTEFNYILNGKMIINEHILETGDIFVLQPYEISVAEFIEDTVLVIARDSSNFKDKFLV